MDQLTSSFSTLSLEAQGVLNEINSIVNQMCQLNVVDPSEREIEVELEKAALQLEMEEKQEKLINILYQDGTYQLLLGMVGGDENAAKYFLNQIALEHVKKKCF